MFDIGFSELMLIAVVALIVIGPERLPKVARTLGHLFGRMQRYVNDVKSDIAREIELDELKKMQSSMEDAARSMRDSVNREVSDAERQLDELTRDAQTQPQPPKSDPYEDPLADGPSSMEVEAPEPGRGDAPAEPSPPPAQKPV